MKNIDNNIKVSIIIPIYNVEKYLPACLNSVISQTLKDIEILCVNDGSTDKSLEILNDFKLKDERITILSKQNSGYGNSMNIAINNANGEYIGIVEPDDFIDKNMFKYLYTQAKKYDADIIKSDFFEFDNRQSKYIMTPTDFKFYNKIINANSYPEIFHFKMNTWTGIYKTKFLRQNDIKYNETPGASYQDNGFWFQTMCLADKIMFVNKAFYHYRKDNPNSSINNPEKVFCMCDEYDFIEKFLSKNPTLKQQFYDWFLVKKFHNYLFTYSRISNEYKQLFLQRFSEEFKPYENFDEFINLLDIKNQNWLKQIINNPKQFDANFDKAQLLVFELKKENKVKKLFSYLKLFGIKKTIKIITQKNKT